jgi:hypothetical protein
MGGGTAVPLRLIHILAVAGLLAFVEPSIAGQPYDFKGISLGITLDQFRKTAHPEGLKSHVVCTGDTTDNFVYRDLEVTGDDKELGIINCGFYGILPEYPGNGETMLWLNMGGGRFVSGVYQFSFIRDRDEVMKLFKIVLYSNVGAMQDVIDALTDKFGPASDTQTDIVQNSMGAKYPQHTYTWSNSVSSIFVQGPHNSLEGMVIVYGDTSLAVYRNSLLEAKKRAVKNRM